MNHTHPNIPDQTDFTRIIYSQQKESFIFEGYWKYLGNGTIEGARLLILPVDRSQSTSDYIEFKSTLGSWSRMRNLNGTEPDTIIPISRNITLPTWGSIVGRHTRGGDHSAIQLFTLITQLPIHFYNQEILSYLREFLIMIKYCLEMDKRLMVLDRFLIVHHYGKQSLLIYD